MLTFFTFDSNAVSSTLGYIGGFIGDIQPLLLPIIAIALGLIIFWGIMSALKR